MKHPEEDGGERRDEKYVIMVSGKQGTEVQASRRSEHGYVVLLVHR